MLDNVCPLLRREVFLPPQEVVPQEEVNGQSSPEMFELPLWLLPWLLVILHLLLRVTLLTRVESVQYVNNGCSLICREPQCALFIAFKLGHDPRRRIACTISYSSSQHFSFS